MGFKQKTVLLCVLYLCLIFFSCTGSKGEELQKFVRLVHYVQANYTKLSENEWARVENQVINFRNTITRRYSNSLTQVEKQRISNGINVINSYRSLNSLAGSKKDNDRNRIDGLLKLLDNHEKQDTSPLGTEQQLLSEKLINDILLELNASIMQGRSDISGKIKVLIFPTIYQRNPFVMNYNALTPVIQEAIDIIITQAKRYNRSIIIDWDFMTNNGQYTYMSNSYEGLERYSQYRNMFHEYDYVVLVYAIDMEERSYCSLSGPLGRSEANAVIWFKENNRHSGKVLAHEIFHTFGAEDLYFEQGVVAQEVEKNFRTMYGNSIMAYHWETSDLDPINAWLLGWNKNPELWYSYFINKRDTSNLKFTLTKE